MKFSRFAFPILIGAAFFISSQGTVRAQAADASRPWNIRVTGISVAAPSDDDKFRGGSGTTVNLLLSPVEGRIVGNDFGDSKLVLFTDDKGTDLTAAVTKDNFKKPGINIWQSGETKTNGEAAEKVDVNATGIPAKGASSLHITATAVFYVASQRKQFTVDRVELKPGAKFDLGDFSVTVTKAGLGQGMFGEKNKFSVTLSCSKNMESLASLDLYDDQGNSLGAERSSWGGGFGSYFVEYTIKQGEDHAKLVATCWTDWKRCEVPIDTTVGLGL